MDDYRSRTELSPVDRAVVRAAAPSQSVRPVAESRSNMNADSGARTAVRPPDAAQVDVELASTTQYAEVHARVSQILADLNKGILGVDAAAGAIQTMIPRPMVIVPLPPASREAVQHAEAVAKRIVAQASHAHAAQGRVSRSAVEQVTAS